MIVSNWLSTCSAATDATSPGTPPSTATSRTHSSSTGSSSNSSIHTNLSLTTLPSVPSLQILTLSGESPATALFIASLKPHQAHVNSLAINGTLLYAASGNEINVYNIMDNTLFDTFNVEKIPTGSVKSIAFCDRKIFTSHQDSKIRIWKQNLQKQHKLIATLPTVKDRLRRSIFPQNFVKIRRHKRKLWIEHHDAVSGLVADKNIVLSISWDRSFKIWQARKFKCLESINKAHNDAINAVVISKGGLIYTGSADKRIKVWKNNEKRYRLIATLEKHKSAVNALALNLDGSVLFSGSCDRSILVWEREDGANHMAVTGALRGHAKAILCLINVRDMLLSGSADRTVRVWQRGIDGRCLCVAVLDGHQTPVRSLAAAEDSGDGGSVKVFSGSFDGEIRVWEVEASSVKGPLSNYY